VVRAQVLENDREKRRLRLGLKQLQPTALDEYIAEHKEGDVVTGRVADVKGNRITVELGEGVQAHFSIAAEERKQEHRSIPSVDVSALSSMLASKWKGSAGGGGAAQAGADPGPKRDVPKHGQIRSFRITKLDPEKKRIDIELAG
jgi:small subunit ribosomal protein S1